MVGSSTGEKVTVAVAMSQALQILDQLSSSAGLDVRNLGEERRRSACFRGIEQVKQDKQDKREAKQSKAKQKHPHTGQDGALPIFSKRVFFPNRSAGPKLRGEDFGGGVRLCVPALVCTLFSPGRGANTEQARVPGLVTRACQG